MVKWGNFWQEAQGGCWFEGFQKLLALTALLCPQDAPSGESSTERGELGWLGHGARMAPQLAGRRGDHRTRCQGVT